MPSLGEKTADYPLGYGLCQCGCGQNAPLLKGYMMKYANARHGRAAYRNRRDLERETERNRHGTQSETKTESERPHDDGLNADRLRRAAALLREALRDDPRLANADVEDAARIVERAAQVFFEGQGELTVQDWVMKEGLTIGETLYDIRVVAQAKRSGKGLTLVPCGPLPEDLDVRVSQRALAGFAPGDLALVSGELHRDYMGKNWKVYLQVTNGIQKCASTACEGSQDG